MTRTLRRLALLLGITGLLVVPTAATAQGAFELATQDDAVFLLKFWGNRDLALDRAKAMGVKSIRVNVAYDKYLAAGRSFAMWDSAVNAIRAKGMKVQFTIIPAYYYAPPNPGNSYLSYKNTKPSHMGAFVGSIARHFQGRVRTYSIDNEPNLPTFLTTTGNINRPGSVQARAALYRKLYIAGYNAVKSVDPANRVLLGEFTSAKNKGKDPMEFLKAMAPAGAGLKADGVAHHPFQFFVPPGGKDTRYWGISNTPKIQAILRDLARKRALRTPAGGVPPLYYTEFAYLRGGIYAQPESQRAKWAGSAVRLVRSQGVRQLVWYMAADPVACGPAGKSPCAAGQRKVWDSSVTSTDSTKVLPTYTALALAVGASGKLPAGTNTGGGAPSSGGGSGSGGVIASAAERRAAVTP